MRLRDELATLVGAESRILVADIDFERPLRDDGLDSPALVDAFFVMVTGLQRLRSVAGRSFMSESTSG